jgi:peptide/nickel transport system ATP-binding protein
MTAPVLELRDVTVTLPTDRGPLRPVDGVSFAVEPGRTLAVVGESGCGKSVTALSVMGLLPQGARIGGSIRFDGRELTTLDAEDWRQKRGREMAMIFQEPMTSLNPAFRAGEQVAEALRLHQGLSPRAALDRAIEMLDHVRIPDAARRAMQYPHQLSGGMRQRVMIAMALACRPRLLIADEPTTALDVTVQAQILALIDELKAETGTAVVLITHDLGVVADHADDVVVCMPAASRNRRRLPRSSRGRSIPTRSACSAPRRRSKVARRAWPASRGRCPTSATRRPAAALRRAAPSRWRAARNSRRSRS